ncbi:DNA (cytosine-5-)-methyltransferase [Candidatus Pacearchaeota archaeon]|nr:DNA (cytosine-5-)-methyltransferase [Candidatus Pacearchaeota archaeon]
MNLLDLFSGIGGFHKGFEQAGFEFEWVGHSDIDKYANAVYQYNFPKAKELGSVKSIRSERLPQIDIITFGSPCQDFSIAGKRLGMGGSRSSLIGEAIRLISECRPRFFIWENVKGTFSSNDGEDFWAIIKAFTDIGGYRLEWQLCNTKWFLPQNRERIYLVGHLGGGSGSKIFPIGESNKQINELQGQFTNTLTARYEGQGNGSYIIEGEQYEQRGIICLNKPKYAENGGYEMGNRVYSYKGLMPTLQSQGCNDIKVKLDDKSVSKSGIQVIRKGKSGKVKQGYSQTGTILGDKGIMTTLDSSANRLIQTNTTTGMIRRLTPKECERLQGFPDNWTNNGQSDTQRYKQLGNAVSVPVVQAVAEKIKKLI